MNKKIAVAILAMVMIMSVLGGCSQSDRVSSNLSKEADNFNVVRQLTVINCIKGDVIFQMTGKISIEVDETENQLEITVEDESGNYQKHFVGYSDNTTYICEDIRATDVDNYKYTLNFNPNMWVPVGVETID
jgi:hypothetical protein